MRATLAPPEHSAAGTDRGLSPKTLTPEMRYFAICNPRISALKSIQTSKDVERSKSLWETWSDIDLLLEHPYIPTASYMGWVTIDAPKQGSLTESDQEVAELVAAVLAISFSLAAN